MSSGQHHARKRAEGGVQASERHLRLLIDQAPAAIAMVDQEMKYLACSRRWLDEYGLEEHSVIGRSHYDVFPECPERWKHVYRRCLEGEVRKCEEDGMPRPDGSVDWVRWEIHPWRDEQDRIGGLILLSETITHRKRLQDQIRQTHKMHAIGQLAGGVAHEFNNMLTVISGYAQLIRSQLPPQSPCQEGVSQIIKAAARNADVTRQLLAFSGQQVLRLQVMPINRVIHSCEGLLGRLVGERIKLRVHVAQDAGHVRVDPTQLQQALLNLVLNSRDAMPDGGTVTLTTRNRTVSPKDRRAHELPPGRYVEIAVGDTGRGMSDEELTHLFEPFFTTKDTARSVGLGLAVMHGIIEQSSGHIRVQSKLGQGTTFYIYLPRTSPEETPTELPMRFPGRSPNETILLVEDEHEVRALAGHLLRQCGYEVLEARSPSDAMERFGKRAEDIQLLLTDVVLPEMSGHELALRLRELKPGLKVVFTSGYGTSELPEKERLTAPFLSKPFDVYSLQAIVRQALDEVPL